LLVLCQWCLLLLLLLLLHCCVRLAAQLNHPVRFPLLLLLPLALVLRL
jgi:hypothetical protein